MTWWLIAGALAFVALFLGLGFVLARVLFDRLVLRLQVAPVTVHDVEVPIDAMVSLEGAIDVNVEVPVEAVLTGRELGLERITVPIDTSVMIDEQIEIDTTVAIDTTVTSLLGVSVPVKANLPIRMRVPIRQRVRVKDSIDITLADVRVPLRAVVPLRAKVPIVEPIAVKGKVRLADGLPVKIGEIRIRPSDVGARIE
ncbi:MAG: hypothetical protein ACRENE_00270 [Polyangiaceae bacterium]